MAAPISSKHRFLGRQAILDRQLQLYGYELLFRTAGGNEFVGDPDDATNQTIDSCLSMIACTTARNLFVNCTRDALVNLTVMLLPRQTVVLEVLESVASDNEVVNACKYLKQSGFRIALDDFSPRAENWELAELADYIKIDFRSSDIGERQEIYDRCRNSKPIFLAEKVETAADVEIAQAEGNTLFQGYYYSKPETIAEAQISGSRATYLQLLAALTLPSLDLQQIERLLLTEPALCFRLLRLANSAVHGRRETVSTIQGALRVVGEDALRKLVTVALASSTTSHPTTDPDVVLSIERAFFCESLALTLGERPAELYMLGMLSTMDRMLCVPMSQLMSMISVGPRIEAALLGSPDGMGRALELCHYHEHGGACQETVPRTDPLFSETAPQYFEALLAAGQTLRVLRR